MVRFVNAAAAILALALTATASPTRRANLPDPAGAPHVGNQNHEQFIGGQCISTLDCALNTACCATLGSIGVCSGLQADTQNGKTGCGFGDGNAGAGSGTSNSNNNNNGNANGSGNRNGNGNANGNGNGSAGSNVGSFTLDPNAPGAQNVGAGNGAQFITGQCISDADCASTCCATDGKCAARLVVESPQDARECGFVGSL
ncbi:hypothetical protein F4777DRAFT_158990 [Nemania sp. FL0916]|nr:hypothetical protein F4777DRAFT_158990 [Nemania sp. FL0916]